MNILVAIDFSPVTGVVLEALEQIAANFSAHVWLIHVAAPDPAFVGYEAGPHSVRNQVADEHRERHQELQGLAERLRGAGVETTALLLQGPTVKLIIEEAGRLSASVIVLGSPDAVSKVVQWAPSRWARPPSKVPNQIPPALDRRITRG